MATQGGSTTATFWQTMLHFGLYKRSQGRLVRQTTFGALAITVLLGVLSLRRFLVNTMEPGSLWLLCVAVAVIGVWVSFRVVNLPRFAEFLISVEGEVAKISWPTWRELRRSSMVVLVTMFGLSALLFFYDVAWQQILQFVGVLSGGEGS